MNPQLEKYISVFEKIEISYAYIIVDHELNYVSASKTFLDYYQSTNLIGRRLKDSDSIFASQAAEYGVASEFMMKSPQKNFHYIAKVEENQSLVFFDLRTSKIFDNESNLIGMVSTINKFNPSFGLVKFLSFAKSIVYIYPPKEKLINIEFTQREQEIICLLMAGYTQKEIAGVLSKIEGREISRNTIASDINRSIYPKLGIDCMSSFFECLRDSSLAAKIPIRLFHHYSMQNS